MMLEMIYEKKILYRVLNYIAFEKQ